MGIIPGSMGARSYIVRGRGNPESFMSCSHGAGRAMSRGEAKRRFTVEDHMKATAGVECRKDADVIDETPMAYKSIDAVMEAQKDLVEIVHTPTSQETRRCELRPVPLNIRDPTAANVSLRRNVAKNATLGLGTLVGVSSIFL